MSDSVFPACAGMFHGFVHGHLPVRGFPRVRGDVPVTMFIIIPREEFSPRARGCSWGWENIIKPAWVFPACAGMFPSPPLQPRPNERFPRVRGDVPALPALLAAQRAVFPACAGMFLLRSYRSRRTNGFPRVRGDVPSRLTLRRLLVLFSPRARGCS